MPGPLRPHQFGGNLLDATCGRIGHDGDAARGTAGQRDQQGERQHAPPEGRPTRNTRQVHVRRKRSSAANPPRPVACRSNAPLPIRPMSVPRDRTLFVAAKRELLAWECGRCQVPAADRAHALAVVPDGVHGDTNPHADDGRQAG